MVPATQFDEIDAIIRRSNALVREGIVAGVRDSELIALYLAASEAVETMESPRLVAIVKEGLDENTINEKRDLLIKVAIHVLIRLASERNGYSGGT